MPGSCGDDGFRDVLGTVEGRLLRPLGFSYIVGYRGENETIVVTAVIGPGPNAVHEKNFFIPDHEYHDAEVARIYAASGRIATYLGDWHSHPNGGARLSKLDRRTLRRIAVTPEARTRQPIMLIVSGGGNWQLTVYNAIRTHFGTRLRTLPVNKLREDSPNE